ncbi:MAG TPA: DUF3482 domain-containing protein [Burkholderiales bacterium]
MPSTPATIQLSLVSHTNVGKTTLARTLLRRDIGEVRDQPHVTDLAEAQRLIDTPQGDVLLLWDTPGFGDSARLLKRLRNSANPLGWLLTQVWDRIVDRPFYSSQQAIRAARDQSDVILYLVSAAEDPASAGYVDIEMQILSWLDKPILLLLNQTGPPREPAAEAADETAWRAHLASFSCVRGVLALDAFARCWTQEDELLDAVGKVLPQIQRDAFARLRAAWRARNLAVFDASARALSAQLAVTATDRETLPPSSLKDQAGRWLTSLFIGDERSDPVAERAMQTLATHLDDAVRNATDRLIALHDLSGHAADEIHARMATQFNMSRPADVGKSGVIGGLASGALGGLTADLAAGGFTFGAGALIGGVLGALGAGGAARAYNLARGTDNGTVGWSAEYLTECFKTALLRYLAVAHFGRGRGDWVAGENPPHWRSLVDEVIDAHRHVLDMAWQRAAAGATRDETERELQPILTTAMRDLLSRLYPETADLWVTTTA